MRVGVRQKPQEQVARALDIRVFYNTYMRLALISQKAEKAHILQ